MNCVNARRLTTLLLVTLLSACSTPARKAPTVVVDLPPAPPKVSISDESRQQFEWALTAIREGRGEDAGILLKALHEQHPELSGPPANLGALALERGAVDEAIGYLEAAVTANARNVRAQNLLGVSYRRAGRFDEALKAYSVALRVDPEYAPAHLNLGIMYDLYRGQPRDALVHYEKYQSLMEEPDENVAIWIASVKRRIDAR